MDISTHTRSLRAFGYDVEKLSPLPKTHIMHKIPADLQLFFHRLQPGEFSLEDLLKLIKAEVEAHRKVRRLGGGLDPKPKSSQIQHTRLATRGAAADSTTAALVVGHSTPTTPGPSGSWDTSSYGKFSSCLFCKAKDHDCRTCPLPLDKRRAALQKEKRCLICPKSEHQEKDCKSDWRCRKCKGDYHQYICPKKSNPTAAIHKTAGEEFEHTTTVTALIPNNKAIVLKTPMVQIYGPNGR